MNKPNAEAKPKIKLSLPLKITILAVLLTAIPLVVFAGVLRFVVLGNIKTLVAQEQIVNTDAFLQRYSANSVELPKELSEDPALRSAVANKDLTRIKSILNNRFAGADRIDILEAGDANGVVLYRAHAPEKSGDNKGNKAEYRNALKDNPQVGFFDMGGGGTIGYRTLYPVKHNGEVVGTILAGIEAPAFAAGLLKEEGSKFILYNNKGDVIESNLPGYTLPSSLKKSIQDASAKKAQHYTLFDVYTDADQVPWVSVFTLLYASNGEYLGAFQVFSHAKDFIDIEMRLAIISISVLVLGIIIAAALAVFASNRLTAPLGTLRLGLERLSKGDRTTRFEIRSNDELEEAANILNHTLDDVLKYAQTDEEYKTLQKNIIELLEVSDALASGDFTKKARVGEGQLGIIADAFNTVANSLRESFNKIKETENHLLDKVKESNEGLSTVAHSREEVTRQIAATQEKANALSDLSAQISELSVALENSFIIEAEKTRKSSMSLTYSTEKIVGIKDSIQENNKKIKKLGEDMLHIANHIMSIQEINKKTNLVAINTAIEANAMGETGKNFAAVAVEIKKMAASNEESSKVIRESADSMLKIIQQLTASMENSITELNISTNETLGSIDSVKSTLNNIVQNITKLQQIVAGSKEQSEYSKEVATGLDEIIHTAQGITDSFVSTNEIIAQMNADIDMIAKSLDKFKV